MWASWRCSGVPGELSRDGLHASAVTDILDEELASMPIWAEGRMGRTNAQLDLLCDRRWQD